jgi:hypothetical protein
MRTGWAWVVAAGVCLAGSAWAQSTAPAAAPAPAGALKVGPATVAPHWSKYDFPKSVPEAAPYVIIERNDTLWDLAKRYLGNPYLWPQIWHENGYFKDAHWIYPGDPLVFPKVQVVAGQAGLPGEEGGVPGALGEAGGLMPTEEGAAPSGVRAGAGATLIPVLSEVDAQCSPYIPTHGEDDGLHVVGSEQGPARTMMATGDILYFSRGEDAGLKPGDVFSIHRKDYTVEHPKGGGRLGTKVQSIGWARVILTQPKSATAVVEQACIGIEAGDYLKPFQKIAVPLVTQTRRSDRMTPPSGKAHGYIVDLGEHNDVAGAGHFAIIDLGTKDGVAPGTPLVIYRVEYPAAPTSRNVLGDMVIVTAQERTATAMIMASWGGIFRGDEVEIR